MAANMYIQFDEIQGAGDSGEIEILSWSHGFTQPTSPVRGTTGTGTVEQASHNNLSFTKYADAATDALIRNCWSGKQIASAVLTCYRSDGSTDSNPVLFLTINMENVVIANFSISGGSGSSGSLPVETISLDYGVITYTSAPQSQSTAGDVAQGVTHNLETQTIS